jgi:hypothetical protein
MSWSGTWNNYSIKSISTGNLVSSSWTTYDDDVESNELFWILNKYLYKEMILGHPIIQFGSQRWRTYIIYCKDLHDWSLEGAG